MVTEKDLYVGMVFTDTTTKQYTIIKIGYCLTVKTKDGNPIDVGTKTLINYVNENTWKIIIPINRCIEIW